MAPTARNEARNPTSSVTASMNIRRRGGWQAAFHAPLAAAVQVPLLERLELRPLLGAEDLVDLGVRGVELGAHLRADARGDGLDALAVALDDLRHGRFLLRGEVELVVEVIDEHPEARGVPRHEL